MKLFSIRSADITQEDRDLVRSCFPGRFAKAERLLRQEDRLTAVGAGVLLHEVLGITDERLIQKTEEGKPYLAGGPQFSLSHSVDRCILAVSKKRIGADIEKMDGGNLLAAEASLTPRERKWTEASPLNRFHILWTRKESVSKAVGGFSDPREAEVLEERRPDGLYLASAIWEGFALSVCADEKPGSLIPVDIRRSRDTFLGMKTDLVALQEVDE